MNWEQVAYDLYIVAARHLNEEAYRQFEDVKKRYANPTNEIEGKIHNLITQLVNADKDMIDKLVEIEKYLATQLQSKAEQHLIQENSTPKLGQRQTTTRRWWL